MATIAYLSDLKCFGDCGIFDIIFARTICGTRMWMEKIKDDLPTSVMVFGEKFKVKRKLLAADGLAGYCDREGKEIVIAKELNLPDAFQTLLHEIGHAVFSRIGLMQAINPEVEEIVVESIATAFSENFDYIG